MILDDLKLLYGQFLSEFRVISRFWEATTAKRMKIDPQCLRQNCSSDVLSNSVQCESKNSPKGPDIFSFFHKRLEFLIDFYAPIMRSYLRQTTNFYSIIPDFDAVMPYMY